MIDALTLGAVAPAQSHQLQRGQNRRQRISQLVPQHGEEFVFRAIGRLRQLPAENRPDAGEHLVGDVGRDDKNPSISVDVSEGEYRKLK